MDKFIVRLSILVLTTFIAVSLYKAWNGVLISEYDTLFSCSLTCGVLLNTLVYSQGKYHCVYMRGLCVNLVFTPSVNFLDMRFGLFEDAYYLLMTLSVSWGLAFLITLVLAINHFRRVRKLNKQKSRFREYEIRR